MKILINSPSLDINHNVSGISSITKFIIDSNSNHQYVHFEIGRRDNDSRNFGWILGFIKSYFRWLYILLFKQISLIHFNLPVDRNAVLRDTPFIIAAKVFGKDIVVHLHGGEYLTNRVVPTWMRWVLNFSLKGNHPVVVLSSAERDVINQSFRCNNVFVLPNCIDSSEASKCSRLSDEFDYPKLLFIGRISLNKGIEYIYFALKELKKKGVYFTFSMAGKGPEQAEYVGKFRELLGDDFNFLGVVTGEEKSKVLRESNVFLLPTFFEGLPMALLESMAFGLVPVVTSVGSIRFIVLDKVNGLIVDRYSSLDIERAIELLADDKKLFYKLSMNAKKFLMDNYNSGNYIDCLNTIYLT